MKHELIPIFFLFATLDETFYFLRSNEMKMKVLIADQNCWQLCTCIKKCLSTGILSIGCLIYVFRCDFEWSSCMWEDLKDDDFDFTRTKGLTDSTGTGPMVDHTTGTASGQYFVQYGCGGEI